ILTVRFRPSLRIASRRLRPATVYIFPSITSKAREGEGGRTMSRVFRGCRTLGGIMSKLYHGDKYWYRSQGHSCVILNSIMANALLWLLSLSGAGYIAYGIGKAA
ncbi:unnamed protein product, partial [Musa hybrid cultivar]